MCAIDTNSNKSYCCEPGNSDSKCWTGATTCAVSADDPSSRQINCAYKTASSDIKWCCLKEETCTQRTSTYSQNFVQHHEDQLTRSLGQFNICWSTFLNPLAAINATKLNQTYFSMSSSSPSATAYTVPQNSILQMVMIAGAVTPTPSAASFSLISTITSASTSATPTTSTSPPPTPGSKGLSGGAIGGIVGGVVGGLALLAIGAFFYRRHRKAKSLKMEPAQDTLLRHELHNNDVKPHLTEGTQIMELSRNEKPAELEQPPVELEAREQRAAANDARG